MESSRMTLGLRAIAGRTAIGCNEVTNTGIDVTECKRSAPDDATAAGQSIPHI
jgi:hypothetical protein